MATRKRKIPGITAGELPPTYFDFIRYKAEKENAARNNGLFATILGGKGSGKSQHSLTIKQQMEKRMLEIAYDQAHQPEVAEITDKELAELHAGITEEHGDIPAQGKEKEYPQFSAQNRQTLIPISNYISAQGRTQWEGIREGVTYYPETRSYQYTTPTEKQEPKKQEFSPEDLKGKFCAVVTATFSSGGVTFEHTGVLFVKKCGHWKLMDFNGDKLGGGTAGSFEGNIEKGKMKIEVHKIIYDADKIEVETVLGVDELEIL
jgi:hypothetical protein